MFKKLLVATALTILPVAASATVSQDTTSAIKSSNWQQASTLITRDLQNTPADAKAWYYKAQIANKLGDNPTTATAIQTAKSIDPSLSFANDKRMVAALEAKSTATYQPQQQQQPAYVKHEHGTGASFLKFFLVIVAAGGVIWGIWAILAWRSERRVKAEAYSILRSETISEITDYLERATRLHYRIQVVGGEELLSESSKLLTRGQTLADDIIDTDEKYSSENRGKLDAIVKRSHAFKKEYGELSFCLSRKENKNRDSIPTAPQSVDAEYQERQERRSYSQSSNNNSQHPSSNGAVVNNYGGSNNGFVTGMLAGSLLSTTYSTNHSPSHVENEPDTDFDSGSSFRSSDDSFDSGSSFTSTDDSSSGFDTGTSSGLFDSSSSFDTGSFGGGFDSSSSFDL